MPHRSLRAFLPFILLLLSPAIAFAQVNDVLTLTPERLQADGSIGLDALPWRYRSGDDRAWADPQTDDGSWEIINGTRLTLDDLPQTVLVEINPASGAGRYVNAGHNECVLLHGSEVESFKSTGLPLGMLAGREYEERSFQMSAGDVLALYTDGVPEAQNAREQEWGEARLCDGLKIFVNETAREIVNRVFEQVDDFAGGAPQHDDITLLVFKRAA